MFELKVEKNSNDNCLTENYDEGTLISDQITRTVTAAATENYPTINNIVMNSLNHVQINEN